jgi:glycosyltransferase involved in cell wall biosynthesis
MGQPTIVGDNPASREVLDHGEQAFLCAMADGRALAEAVLALRRDPDLREHLGKNGRQLFEERFSLGVQAERLRTIVSSVVNRNSITRQ